jgi:hypothetical protein
MKRRPTVLEAWTALRSERVREARAAGTTFESTMHDMDCERMRRIINGDRGALADLFELLADGQHPATPQMLRDAAALLRTRRGRGHPKGALLPQATMKAWAADDATRLRRLFGIGAGEADELATKVHEKHGVRSADAVRTRRRQRKART